MFDEICELFFTRRNRRERLCRFDEEARERLLVADELGEDVVAGGEGRAEVFRRGGEVAALAGVLFGRPLKDLGERLARGRVEGVEQSVEIDGVAGLLFGPGERAM